VLGIQFFDLFFRHPAYPVKETALLSSPTPPCSRTISSQRTHPRPASLISPSPRSRSNRYPSRPTSCSWGVDWSRCGSAAGEHGRSDPANSSAETASSL
jgi:hypothetical protein